MVTLTPTILAAGVAVSVVSIYAAYRKGKGDLIDAKIVDLGPDWNSAEAVYTG